MKLFVNFILWWFVFIAILVSLFITRISVKIRYFILGLLFALILVFLQYGYQFIQSLPNPRLIGTINFPVTTQILDRNGKLLYEVYRDQNRTPVILSALPTYVKDATIAIEDKEFYRHSGISITSGVLRAIRDMILTRTLQGGSTITQQLVKSALLTPERTINRKIKEIILALWTEKVFTKNQILEMYLNPVPYGGSSYGIEEAARTYFDKPAAALSLSEAAFLAGLPQAPSLYSPYVNPDLALWRRNDVLKQMYSNKYLTGKQYKETTAIPISVKPLTTSIKAPHFVFYIKSLLENEYGSLQVEDGGYRVITSLDLELQEKAETILKEELDKIRNLRVSNGAILITKPNTGEILSMVGSYDYFATPSGAFNSTLALRQPGSSIKPVMYSLALERGYTAASLIDDSPVTFTFAGASSYQPVNYDGRYHGRVTLRQALANSYNVPAVKVLNTLGVTDFIKQAKELGITTWNQPERYGLSLTLGGAEVQMVDMAVAFGVFANYGYKTPLSPILQISDFRGKTLFEKKSEKSSVLSPAIAYIISDILSDNIARRQAFGTQSLLEIPGKRVAVKTGTTNDKKDNWTIGYTPDFLVAVWVGNNDNTSMNPHLTSGITGAAPIWNRAMSTVLNMNPKNNTPFIAPEEILAKNCYGNAKELFIKGTEQNVPCARVSVTPKP